MTHTRLKPAAADFVAGTVDPLWDRLRAEAESVAQAEPALTSFLLRAILHQPSLEAAIDGRLDGIEAQHPAAYGRSAASPAVVEKALSATSRCAPESAATCCNMRALRSSACCEMRN